MAQIPKTLYKDNGAEVTFVDTSADVKKAIEKLSKDALGASAKIIRKKLRTNVPKRTKLIKNHIASWKFIDKKTGQPTLHIGFYSWQMVKKKGKLPSHASPWWIEFGTNPHIMPGKKGNWEPGHFMRNDNAIFGYKVNHPGQRETHLLRNTIQDNIGEIRAAQEEYLKKISETLDAANITYDNTPDEENN